MELRLGVFWDDFVNSKIRQSKSNDLSLVEVIRCSLTSMSYLPLTTSIAQLLEVQVTRFSLKKHREFTGESSYI